MESQKKAEAQNDDKDDTDELLEDVIEMVIETGQASTSFIQRRFKVGYSRAGRIMDQMEQRELYLVFRELSQEKF